MNNMQDFFLEISKSPEEDNNSLLLEKLFKLNQTIGKMSADDLIALYLALKTLKRNYPNGWFKKNPTRNNVEDTQLVIIQAMSDMVQNGFDCNLEIRFNKAIANDWIHYNQHRI